MLLNFCELLQSTVQNLEELSLQTSLQLLDFHLTCIYHIAMQQGNEIKFAAEF